MSKSAFDLSLEGYIIQSVRMVGPQKGSIYFFNLGENFEGLDLKPEVITMYQAQGEGDQGYIQVKWSDNSYVNYYHFDCVRWIKLEHK
jgi:hypothetical protein